MAPDMEERFQTLQEIVKAAKQNLAPGPWDYLIGGAETETTLRRNRQALDSIALRPRVLRDVSRVDCTTTLLGRRIRIPVMLAPIGSIESFDPGGGASSAKAAAEFGIPQMLSSVCNPGLEAVAKAADNFRIFQLYVRGDDAWVDDHVKRAVDHGYAAFCLTVDTASYSRRERDLAKRFVKPWRVRATGFDYQAGLTWDHVKRFKDTHDVPLAPQGHRDRGGRGARDRSRRRHRLRVQSRRPAARSRARQHRRAARGRRCGRRARDRPGGWQLHPRHRCGEGDGARRRRPWAWGGSNASGSRRRACPASCARSSCSRTRCASRSPSWACRASASSIARICTPRRRSSDRTRPARSRCSRRGTSVRCAACCADKASGGGQPGGGRRGRSPRDTLRCTSFFRTRWSHEIRGFEASMIRRRYGPGGAPPPPARLAPSRRREPTGLRATPPG